MLKKINLQVAGMTCAVCVANIESAIGELAGAYKIVVSLAMGSEQVECSPEVTSPAEIVKTIKIIGYDVTEKVEGQEVGIYPVHHYPHAHRHSAGQANFNKYILRHICLSKLLFNILI